MGGNKNILRLSQILQRSYKKNSVFQHRTLHPEGLNTDFNFI